MSEREQVLVWRLSAAVAAIMAIQAVVGVAAPSLYRDADWITAAWFGNDIVTALVAVPLLVWALVVTRRGSRRAELVWYSMLGYSVYNYAYYLFGAMLNWFFPVYVALFTAPVIILVLALGHLDARAVAAEVAPATPVRWIGGYMLFTGTGLTVAWLAQWANFMLTGAAPDIGAEPFKLVAAMDLSFMVPWFVIGAVLLMRRRPWGYVIAAIILVKGMTYTLVLATTSTVGAMRGIDGALQQIPIWSAWTLVGALAAWGLFSHIGSPHR